MASRVLNRVDDAADRTKSRLARAEAALHRANAMLRRIEQLTGIGGWRWDVARDAMAWSDEIYRLLGQDKGGVAPSLAALLAAVHPDDRGVLREAIDAALAGLEDVSVELRVVRPDGGERLVEIRAEIQREGYGKVVAIGGTAQDVSARKRAEQRMAEQEQRFRALVEQNVAGIAIIRDDDTIAYVNPYLAALTGHTAPEMIGRPLLDFVAPGERQAIVDNLPAKLSDDAPFVQRAAALQARDGRTVDVLVNASRLVYEDRPASIAVLVDISDRRRAERELAFNASVLATEHDTSPDGIIVVAPDRSIISFNRRFCEIWGLEPEAVAGRPACELLLQLSTQAADPEALIARGRELFAHRDACDRAEIALRDGRVLERYSAPMKHVEDVEQHLGRIWFFRDITARTRAEIEQRRLNRVLRTLSAGNEVLIRAASEAELLREMCRVITETGGYQLAWIGEAQFDAAKTTVPIASAGDHTQYLDQIRISWAEEPHGMGVSGRALRSGAPQTSQDVGADPHMEPWRIRSRQYGFRAAAALPLNDGSPRRRALVIYAAERDAFDAAEMRLLCELAADLSYGIAALRDRAEREMATRRWQATLEATIGAIAATAEMRDPYTAGHQQRVAQLAAAIARELQLPEHRVQGIHLAGTIHDVGKIGVPAEILNKPGRLTAIEYQLIQGHAQAGHDILKGVAFPWPIAEIVLQHHERLDGSGYPNGLKSEAILLEAKIIAVADTVEAMMARRPYREPLGLDAALAEIERGKGSLYDPAVAGACAALFRDRRFDFV